jgi:hypothetical protein
MAEAIMPDFLISLAICILPFLVSSLVSISPLVCSNVYYEQENINSSPSTLFFPSSIGDYLLSEQTRHITKS